MRRCHPIRGDRLDRTEMSAFPAGLVTIIYQFIRKNAHRVQSRLLRVRASSTDVSLGISIGGWTMSQAFRVMTSNSASICKFVSSIKDWYTRFPSYSHVDINWEYPNAVGDTNVEYGPEDPARLARLLRAIKTYVPDINVKIAVAGSVEKLKAANLGLYDKYVDNYNVMTYDYFGSFSDELTHHTNLGKPDNNNGWSVSAAVEFIIENYNISSHKINIGYAAYACTVSNTTITSFNPLRGTFKMYRVWEVLKTTCWNGLIS